MKNGFKDWLGLVASAHSLEGTIEQWIEILVDKLDPFLNLGHGMTANLYRLSPNDVELEYEFMRGTAQQVVDVTDAVVGAVPRAAYTDMLRYGSTAMTLREFIVRAHPSFATGFRQATKGFFTNVPGIVCVANDGRVLCLSTARPAPRTLKSAERRRLNRIAAHVGSGLRLRTEVESLDRGEDAITGAIFQPDGKVLDARGLASSKSSLDRLRHAIVQSERVRGPLRYKDTDQARSLWDAFVKGRWSLVDHFECAGSRMVVAVKNVPEVRDPRGLTLRQLQIAETLGRGRSSKEIGYTFGISVSAVNNAIAEVRQKLALRSRAEVAAFFAPGGVRVRLSRMEIGEQLLLIGAFACCDGEALSMLSEAEHAVALLLLQGATNQAIVQHRQSSYNTVANQIKSVYSKLGVTNRAGLAALLSSSSEG